MSKIKVTDCIPDEVIVQILQKLPIKFILRCTCVSKSWLSLIKSCSFISTHRNLSISSSNNKPRLLFRLCRLCRLNSHQKRTEYYSVCYDDTQVFNYNPSIHPHFPFVTLQFDLVGTVNGLVCLGEAIETKQTVILWNPLIKKSVKLPKPMSTCRGRVAYGFGFRSNDYKVLRLAQPLVQPGDTLEAEVFSFNTNSWKWVCSPTCQLRFGSRQVFVNGVIHVSVFRTVGDNEPCNLILGIDVGDETFHEIALPLGLVDQERMSMNLLVYKDSIALFEEDWDSGRANVWVMEVYGDVDSWSRILTFEEQGGTWPTVFGFRRNGELFLQSPLGEIVLHDYENPENRSLEVSGSFPFVDYFVESLELLDNANARSDATVAAGDATAVND